MMKISGTSTMTAPAIGVMVHDLKDWLSCLPEHALVTSTTEVGDRGGSGNTRYTARWDEDK